MIRLLALSGLLALLPLPLTSLAALTTQVQTEEGETGMGARPHFVVEAGVRVPAATSASVASRSLLPSAVLSAPPAPSENRLVGAEVSAPRAPSERQALLGRLLLDGG